MCSPIISIVVSSTPPISIVLFTGKEAYGTSTSTHATPTGIISTMDVRLHGTTIAVDVPEATMLDVISIMLLLQDTALVTVDTNPDIVVEDTIPATVDTIPATVVVTVDMVLPMVVVTEIMEAMVVMAPQEDKPHNTYFIDNPLIIGG